MLKSQIYVRERLSAMLRSYQRKDSPSRLMLFSECYTRKLSRKSLITIHSWTIISILVVTSSTASTSESPKSRIELVTARSGVVSSEETACSNIGRDILAQGGNAVDASVAAAFCLGVVNPSLSGLGGGGFILIKEANKDAVFYDMEETAPKRAFKDMYKHRIDQIRGKLSIAVPGHLAGLYDAWRKHGKLPWNRLVGPSEKLARSGMKISKFLHQIMDVEAMNIRLDPMLRSIFTMNGKLLKPGDTFRLKTLADTLKIIAESGKAALYGGVLGQRLINDLTRKKPFAILSMEDLRNYQVKIRKPLNADVMGLRIVSAPPPSSGGAVTLLVLKILEQYGLPSGVSGPLGTHRMIEALKYALAIKTDLADPDFVNVNSTLAAMLYTGIARRIRLKIDDAKTYPSNHYKSKWKQTNDHGTTHICVVDNQRNAVSMSISLNSMFGSEYISPSTGILLNNKMFEFSIPGSFDYEPPPSPVNFISPMKRPLSSMMPTIILKGGKLKAVIGATGGRLIPDAIIQVILNHFVRNMSPTSSVLAPRYYHKLYPNILYYENYTSNGVNYRVPKEAVRFLVSRNHVTEEDTGQSTSCVFVDLGSDAGQQLFAATDPRRGGSAAGY